MLHHNHTSPGPASSRTPRDGAGEPSTPHCGTTNSHVSDVAVFFSGAVKYVNPANSQNQMCIFSAVAKKMHIDKGSLLGNKEYLFNPKVFAIRIIAIEPISSQHNKLILQIV